MMVLDSEYVAERAIAMREEVKRVDLSEGITTHRIKELDFRGEPSKW